MDTYTAEDGVKACKNEASDFREVMKGSACCCIN